MKKFTDLESYFADDDAEMLDEVSYKELFAAVNPRDLPHRDYAPLIKSVNYVGTRGNTMKFFVPSSANGWNCYVRFPAWEEQVADRSLNANEAARLLLWSENDLQLRCLCPSFSFHGYAYILTQLGAAITPETRFPHIRNPQLKGIACKHMRRCLRVLPFNLGHMAAAIKQQRSFGGGG